jgi:protein phosphatase
MIEKILEDFENATSEDFIEIVDKVINLLDYERSIGKIDELYVKDDLIYCSHYSIDRCIIIGDIHGDLETLLKILKKANINELKNQRTVIVFLGDYGDRGDKSVEVYYLLLRLKLEFKEKIIMLRGNHEGPDDLLAQPHDLPLNFIEKYGQKGYYVYLKIRKLFDKFYLAFVILNKIIALHGGIPSNAITIDDIAIARKIHPKKGILEEILWNDPMEDIGLKESYRGAGKLFGKDITENFLKRNNLLAVIRGHEPARIGYFLSHEGKVLTLFSRKGPPYFNEKAAYIDIQINKLETHKDLEKFIVTV